MGYTFLLNGWKSFTLEHPSVLSFNTGQDHFKFHLLKHPSTDLLFLFVSTSEFILRTLPLKASHGPGRRVVRRENITRQGALVERAPNVICDFKNWQSPQALFL